MTKPTKEGLELIDALTLYIDWFARVQSRPARRSEAAPTGHVKKFEAFLDSRGVKKGCGRWFLVYLIKQMKESRGFVP